MKNIILTALCLLTGLLIVIPATAQQNNILLYGTVTWSADGSPAASVKVRVLSGTTEIATTYTDSRGTYGLLNVNGNPGDYTLEVEANGKVVKKIDPATLATIARGTCLDLKLDKP